MRFLLIALFLFPYLSSTAQDTAVVTTKLNIGDLIIDMPGQFYKTDATSRTVYSSQGKNCLFQVTHITDSIKISTTEELAQVHRGFINGYTKSKLLSTYHTTITDTAVGGTKGKIFVSTASSPDSVYQYVYNYSTPANGRFYIIGIFSAESVSDKQYFKNFFGSIDFTANTIRENYLPTDEEARLYNIGYSAGRIFGFLIVVGILSGIIYFIVRMARKK